MLSTTFSAIAKSIPAIPLVLAVSAGHPVFADSPNDFLVTVSTVDALRKAASNAVPGIVIEVEDGVYSLPKDLLVEDKIGTRDAPIVIRARNLLKAEIMGPHRIKVKRSEYIVVEGFRLTMKADLGGKDGVVNFYSCKQCRVTRNHFELDETETGDGNQTWLTFSGTGSENNRVDHNLFENKTKEGYFLFMSGSSSEPTQHDIVERNHFRNRAHGGGENGWETIRGGQSTSGNVDGGMFLTIRENLFERCNGEAEMVSFKTGDCGFLGNTVLDCHGSVCFRSGNRGVAAGNFFFNTLEEGPFDDYEAGGVRFYGSDHKIYNNYFEGLNGMDLQAPLSIMHGAPAGSGALGGADALPSTRCEIVHNTWVNCRPLTVGYEDDKRPLPPKDCIFANNILYGENDKRTFIRSYEADGVTFLGNIAFPVGRMRTTAEGMDPSPEQIRVADPLLANKNGCYRLSNAASPAINGTTRTFPYVVKDVESQDRDERPDVGADEFSTASAPTSSPLTPNDVGPRAE